MRYLNLLACLLTVFSPALAQPQPTPILFWHFYGDETRSAFWQALADEFNQSNTEGVQVEIGYFPAYPQQHDAILSGLVNGGLPDVALVRNTDAALYQLSDALFDLSPLLAADLDTEKMVAEFLMQDQLAGEQLGIPLTRAAAAMYINLDALRDLGYENPPQTVDALGEMACAFHAQSGLPSVVGFDVPLDASYLLAFLFPQRVYEDGRFDFAPLEKSLLWLKDLLARGCVRLSINEPLSPQNRFASGQSLFYFDSTSAKNYLTDAIGFFNAEPFDLGMLPIPAQDTPVSNWTGPSLSIFRSDPTQEAEAWAWIRWLLEPAQVERWARLNHTVPIWEDVVNPEMAAFQSAAWMAEPHFAGYDVIRDEIVFAVRDILMGGDMTTRLNDLTVTANQIRDAFVQE